MSQFSVLRCLGIPSRVVTNYSSAHDTDASCTVDIHFSEVDGNPIKELNKDSVWNFHVWNDCWMTRPDLPPDCDGWQSIDATPQEKSNGVYRVGPASVKAVKRGDVSLNYDTFFMFSQVNADKCYWIVNGDNEATLSCVKKNEIGRMILTKRPGRELLEGDADRMDVTSEYKHYEMTMAERYAVVSALLHGRRSLLEAYKAKDVIDAGSEDAIAAGLIQFDLDIKSAKVGEQIEAILKASNNSKSEEREVKATLTVSSLPYTGVEGKKIASKSATLLLPPNQAGEVVLRVEAETYVEMLEEQSMFAATAMAQVYETRQVFTDTSEFRLKLPKIELLLVKGEKAQQSSLGVDREVCAKVPNPLKVTLSNCWLTVEGAGLSSRRRLFCDDIPAEGTGQLTFSVRPWRSGRLTLNAVFESTQLRDFNGQLCIDVCPHTAV